MERFHHEGSSPAKSIANGARLTALALAFAGGLTLGQALPRELLWGWLLFAGSALILALLRRDRVRLTTGLFMAAMMSLGAAWIVVHHERVRDDALVLRVMEDRSLLRVIGRAGSSPSIRDRLSGSLGQFSFRGPASYFRLDAEFVIARDGSRLPVTGQLLVSVEQTLPPFRAGDRVEVLGTIARFPPAANPGEFDREAYAKALGQAGLMRVPRRELVVVEPVSPPDWVSRAITFRESLMRQAGGWLRANLPATERTEREAVLAAMLLGERGPDMESLDDAFRRTGLSHLLAISGLHLGVLASVLLMAFRATGRHRAWHSLATIAVIVSYLMMIELRVPVLRAGLMICFACAGAAYGRRLHVSGLLALSAVLLLLWRPDQLFSPGFQLSYGVVLGLVHFTGPVRRRLFGAKNKLPASASAMMLEYVKDLIVVSLVAWLIAVPVVVHHFGMLTLLAMPASVISIPVVTLLLAVGYVKMLLGVLLPSVGLLLGVTLSVLADMLISLVLAIDAIPYGAWNVPGVTTAWTATALAITVLLLTARTRRSALLWSLALVLTFGWALRPRSVSALRVDMLAVGDGSCLLIRSGGNVMVFDAGSSSDLNAGRSLIVPTFRRLGVRAIDGIVISHPDLDHYSAVIELIEAFPVQRVYLTPQLLREAAQRRDDAIGSFLDQLARREVSLATIEVGAHETHGRATWTWLHPPGDANFPRNNDGSAVIRIEAAGRSMLLTGDLMGAAMAMLLGDPDALRADVLELPHHGGYHDLAVAFVEAVGPRVVMQSTGWTRWRGDRWAPALEGQERLVTARDGAVWITIADDGTITTGRYRE